MDPTVTGTEPVTETITETPPPPLQVHGDASNEPLLPQSAPPPPSPILIMGDIAAWRPLNGAQGNGRSVETAALETPVGCLVRTSMSQGAIVSVALAFVPGVRVAEDCNNGGKLVPIHG